MISSTPTASSCVLSTGETSSPRGITLRGEIISPLVFVHLADSLSQQIHLRQFGDTHQGFGSVETMGSPVAIYTQSDRQEVAGAVSHAMPCPDMVSLRYAALRLS